jgi:hypothetical protein
MGEVALEHLRRTKILPKACTEGFNFGISFLILNYMK